MDRTHLPTTELVSGIMRTVRDLTEDLGRLDRRAKRLASTLSAEPRASVDYSVHATSFTYLYYLGNFAKASVVGHSQPCPTTELDVLDLGTGSGAGIAGFVTGLSRQGDLPATIRIHGVDNSRPQLALFRRLTLPYLNERFGDTVEVSLEKRDITQLSATDVQHADYVLDSHALTELHDAAVESTVETIANCGETGPTLVMIEQGDTGLYRLVGEAGLRCDVDRTGRELRFSVPKTLDELDMGTPVYNQGSFSYATFEQNEGSRVRGTRSHETQPSPRH